MALGVLFQPYSSMKPLAAGAWCNSNEDLVWVGVGTSPIQGSLKNRSQFPGYITFPAFLKVGGGLGVWIIC